MTKKTRSVFVEFADQEVKLAACDDAASSFIAGQLGSLSPGQWDQRKRSSGNL
jgi:hypothetical protein